MKKSRKAEKPKSRNRNWVFLSLLTFTLASFVIMNLPAFTRAEAPAASATPERTDLRPPASQPAENLPPLRLSHEGTESLPPARRPLERMRDLHGDDFAGGASGLRPAFRPDLLLTPEQEKGVLAWMEKNFPEQYKAYQEYSRANPDSAPKRKQHMLGRFAAMMQLAQEEPALADTVIADFRLQEEIARVVSQWHRTSDPAYKSDSEAKLTDLLTRQAQVRLENRRLKLDGLAKRVEAERNRLKFDQERISELVQTRRAELLRTPPSTSQPASQPRGR